MDDLVKQLAAGASTYLQELRGRDVPLDLSYQLVRDWHAARLASYYGPAQAAMNAATLPAQDVTSADAHNVAALIANLRERGLLGRP